MLSLTVPLYANLLGISYALIGVATAAVSLGTMCFDLPSSLIFDRVGDKRMVILSFSCMALSSVGLILARSFQVFVVSLALCGVGISLWGFTRIYFIASKIPFMFRGRVSSIFGATQRVGLIVGPVIAGLSVALFSYNAVYGIIAGLVLVTIVGFLSSGRAKANSQVQNLQGNTDSSKTTENHGDGVLQEEDRSTSGYGRRNAAYVFLFQILIMIVRNGRYFLIPLYGVNILHLDPATVGLTVGLSGLFDLFAAYPSGYLLDRYGRWFPTVMAFSLFGSGLLLMSMSETAALFTLSVMIVGLGNGLSAGILLTLGSDISSQYTGRARSRFLGLWNFSADGGYALGPLAMGALSGAFGLVAASRSLAFFAFFICIGLPGFLLLKNRTISANP